jgi:hypothetical protein
MIDHIINYFNTTKFRFSAIVCIIFILLLLLTKSNMQPKKLDHEYKKNINNISREEMELEMIKIIESNNISISDKLWVACKDGLIKGCVTGSITGGFMGAITGGAIFAIANPLLLYINTI